LDRSASEVRRGRGAAPLGGAVRRLAIGLVFATSAMCVGAAATPPRRARPAPVRAMHIMSMNACTDVLLLDLVPKSRIASVSQLAHDAVTPIEPGLDRGVAINHGAAEEVLQQHPDLILAGTFSTPTTRRLARQIGARMVLVEPAESFDQIRQVTRQIGQAVGEPERAEALIARMDGKLAQLRATTAPPIRVLAWSGDESVPGKGTLTDAIIEAAGAINVGAKLSDARYGRFDLEELIKERPTALLQGVDSWDQPSLREDRSAHRLVRDLYSRRRIVYPEALYGCGVPQSVDAAIALRAALSRLPKQGPVY